VKAAVHQYLEANIVASDSAEQMVPLQYLVKQDAVKEAAEHKAQPECGPREATKRVSILHERPLAEVTGGTRARSSVIRTQDRTLTADGRCRRKAEISSYRG